jgi:hypothetical protein
MFALKRYTQGVGYLAKDATLSICMHGRKGLPGSKFHVGYRRVAEALSYEELQKHAVLRLFNISVAVHAESPYGHKRVPE